MRSSRSGKGRRFARVSALSAIVCYEPPRRCESQGFRSRGLSDEPGRCGWVLIRGGNYAGRMTRTGTRFLKVSRYAMRSSACGARYRSACVGCRLLQSLWAPGLLAAGCPTGGASFCRRRGETHAKPFARPLRAAFALRSVRQFPKREAPEEVRVSTGAGASTAHSGTKGRSRLALPQGTIATGGRPLPAVKRNLQNGGPRKRGGLVVPRIAIDGAFPVRRISCAVR